MASFAILVRDGALRRAFERAAHAAGGLVDAAGDVAALRRLIERRAIAVVLAEWPRSDALAALIAEYPETCFIVVAEEAQALDAALAGARAVLRPPVDLRLLSAAIELAMAGSSLVPAPVLDRLRAAGGNPGPGDQDAPALTPREREVLAAMADGASNKAIARRLDISFHTVKFHVAAILEKLDAETRTEAIARAARLGLVML